MKQIQKKKQKKQANHDKYGQIIAVIHMEDPADHLQILMFGYSILLAFIVSGEKSGVILIGLPLYVT